MDGKKANPAPENPVENAAGEKAITGGEREKQISDILKRRMGELATKAADLEGQASSELNGASEDGADGVDTNIIIAEKDRTDTSNAINEAVSRNKYTRIPIVGPAIAAFYRAHVASTVRKNGGDVNAAFKELKIGDGNLINKDSGNYAQMRARLALEDSGFAEDKVDASNSFRLNEGEKIEKVKDERQEKVTEALKDLFENLEKAKKHGDKEEYNLAKKEYLDQVDTWQNEGLFGERQSNLGRKILESKIATFLIGDHSKKSMTELDGLRKMADGVEDLVNEKVAQDDFNSYIDNHLSLYNASMKEGIYTKQKVNSVVAAVAAGGLAGAVAYSLLGRGRSSAKQAVGAEIAKESVKAVSNAAAGMALGGAFGAAAGMVRGINRARANMSKAETEQALSGEEIVTPEEKAARKIEVTDASDAEESESEQLKDEKVVDEKSNNEKSSEEKKVPTEGNQETEFRNLTRRQQIAAVMGKVNGFKRKLTGEDRYEGRVEEFLQRKSAKNFYDELNDKLTIIELFDMKGQDRNRKISELKDKDPEALAQMIGRVVKSKEGQSLGKTVERFQKFLSDAKNRDQVIELLTRSVADVRARNKVSAEEKIDLISYSKGNVDRERMLLGEKMAQAQRLVDAKAVDEIAKDLAEGFADNNRQANKERGKYVVRQALVDAVIGGTIGAAAGGILGKLKDLKADGGDADTIKGELGSDANDSAVSTEVNSEVNVEEASGSHISIEDRDGDGVFAIYDREGNPIIAEEQGITIDPVTGKISDSDLEAIRGSGIEIKELETVTEAPGYSRVGIESYFSKTSERYIDNIDVENGEIDAANAVVGIEVNSYVEADGFNRAADIIVDPVPINEGDIVLHVTPLDNSIDVDNLRVALTPSREIGDMGIVLDVAEDGTVTIPAGSAAASMFADGAGGFTGGAMEIVRDSANGNGFDVLGTSFGTNELSEVGFSDVRELTNFSYTVDGAEINMPSTVLSEANVDAIGVESIRNSGPVEYAPGETEITVNGLGSSENTENLTILQREGNYSEAEDPFLSPYKESPALNSYNMVQRLVDPDMEMTSEEANAALIEAVNDGEINTGQVVNAYLEQMGNSPEQIVEMRAMLGDLQFDIDGDGAAELIDTDWEVNAVADILKNSAEPEGYSAFVNDTYSLLYEKMDGGEIRLINYAEEPYEYTTLGYLDKMNNVIHQFARKKSACTGIGIEFLDKDGKSVYNLDIARRIWKMPANANLERVTERLNCGQKTADVSWIERAKRVVVESGEVKNPVVMTPPPATPSTTVPVTPTPTPPIPPTPTPPTPTPPIPPTPTPPTPPTPEIVPKTDTNPWIDNNPSPMPVTPSFAEESANNGGAPIIQAGQEQIPVSDTSGINTNPVDMQDWAEQATTPEVDVGVNPADQSPSSDAQAAQMLAESEAALRASVGGGSQ